MVTFLNDAAGKDIEPFTTHFGNMDIAKVSPYNLAQGKAAVAEEQTITLNSDGTSGTFTLSFTHGGQTYETAAVSLEAAQADVQSALDTAVTLADAELEVTFWNGKQLVVAFGGSLAGEDVADLVVTPSAATTEARISLEQGGLYEANPTDRGSYRGR